MTCSKSRRDFGGGEGAGERTGWMTDRIVRGGLGVWWLGRGTRWPSLVSRLGCGWCKGGMSENRCESESTEKEKTWIVVGDLYTVLRTTASLPL